MCCFIIYFLCPWCLAYYQICSRHSLYLLNMKIHLYYFLPQFSSVQFSSVAQLCPTLFDPMNHSTRGLPVHHQVLEFTQTHVHRVSDAIQPSHPLSSASPPAHNPSQHQSFPMSQLFGWGGQSTGVLGLASFLPKNTQDWSPLGWAVWISLQFKRLSRILSNTTVQKHQFFVLNFLYGPTLTSIHDY